jgi:probable RNA-binding protein EIF1AD
MSGCKRRSNYRKHVSQAALGDAPELEDGDGVVRVIGSRGGNIFEVESGDGARSLARLPTKFHKLVWVKRGSFLLVTSSEADYLTSSGEAGKVVFNIKAVLLEEQVAALKDHAIWPDAFRAVGELDGAARAEASAEAAEAAASRTIDMVAYGGAAFDDDGVGEEDDVDGDMEGVFRNRNRAGGEASSTDDESSEEAWLARSGAK